MIKNLLLLIPLLPFVAFSIQIFIGRKLPRGGDWVSVFAIFSSFVLALIVFFQVIGKNDPQIWMSWAFTWLPLSELSGELSGVRIGVMADNMTAIMLLMVTLCATLIHLFSTWYMHGEVRYSRFFAYLSLFTGSMLGLVVSDNLLTLFIFWELMGFCSYSLIGFYFERESAVRANIKAFMTTRIGDTCLFVGIMILWMEFKSLRFEDIYHAISAGGALQGEILGVNKAFLAGFLVLMGTVGKSAQFPLQVWLPDAMEGPTPVSALIHAATMVAAGVYLILRMTPLLQLGDVLIVVAYIGAFTAFFASLLAVIQNDIKGVLAYSTISQLGYMVLGVGVGAYAAAFMHLITHALFKACLFMSSGSVIHGVHTQDMREMGGLRKKMPITCASMTIATCAIAGFPFFSGFVSKDKILAQTLYVGGIEHSQHILLPIFGFTAAAITAFYMFRLIFLTFFGEPRDHHKYEHTHKEHVRELNRWIPLAVLAGLSLSVFFSGSITGALHSDQIFGAYNDWFENLIQSPVHHLSAVEDEHGHHLAHNLALTISLVVAFGGALLSALFYFWKKIDPNRIKESLNQIYVILQNKYYFDWFYIEIIIKRAFIPVAAFFGYVDMELYDRYVIDGWAKVAKLGYGTARLVDDEVIDYLLVDGAGRSAFTLGLGVRVLQNGKVQGYLMIGVLLTLCSAFYIFLI